MLKRKKRNTNLEEKKKGKKMTLKFCTKTFLSLCKYFVVWLEI